MRKVSRNGTRQRGTRGREIGKERGPERGERFLDISGNDTSRRWIHRQI